MTIPSADRQSLDIAHKVHQIAGARQTILFGSRARGDHRRDSDVDLLLIMDPPPTDQWLKHLHSQARAIQKAALPQASGIDILTMTQSEFQRAKHLKNNLANSIARHGHAIMPDESMEYRYNYHDEQTDWDDVRSRLSDATEAAHNLDVLLENKVLDLLNDKMIGHAAQTALENGYKALLGSRGLHYPTSGRDGHNLQLLVTHVRNDLAWPVDQPVPGEQHTYLTEFSGAALYVHEHQPLDKERIATQVPEAVQQLRVLVEQVIPG